MDSSSVQSTSASSAWLLITTYFYSAYPWAQAKPRSLVVGAVPKASPRQTRSPSCRTWAQLPSAVGEKTKGMLKLLSGGCFDDSSLPSRPSKQSFLSPLAERVPCAWIEQGFWKPLSRIPLLSPKGVLQSNRCLSAQQLDETMMLLVPVTYYQDRLSSSQHPMPSPRRL